VSSLSSDFEVVIPAYNAESTVRDSVTSSFRAGASRVFVIDDGSTDRTADAAREAGALVETQPNAGASVARRSGIAMVGAPYVIMLDSDDSLIAEGIVKSLALLRGDSGFAAVGGSAVGVFGDGREALVLPNERNLTTASLLRQGFAPVPPACIVWRSEALEHALLKSAPEPLLPRYAEDYEMLVRVSMHGRVLLHEQPSARYALEGGKSVADPSRSVRSVARMREYYADYCGIEIPAWNERSIRARVELRKYKNARNVVAAASHLLRTGLNDPGLVAGLIANKTRRRSTSLRVSRATQAEQ
jgi:glycosyltransferase involved in cell wall biosynthesis